MNCPTSLELERWLSGACATGEAGRIEEHCTSCAPCGTWLSVARADESLVGDLRLIRRSASSSARAEVAPGAAEDAPALARYRVLRRIGAGGMGIVYEAEQRGTRRRVALKVLRAGLSSARSLRRFEHEAEVLARLDHPGIARVLEADTFESHGERRPFFAMELIEGRALSEAALELDQRRRVELVARIGDAVHHAHQKGVLHRDLKPANVLVTHAGEPKILDFGVARSVDPELHTSGALSLSGELLGTLPYMSPEQLSGDPLAVDVRSDVFALGVTLFELLSGRRPRDTDGMSFSQAVRALTQGEAPPLRELAPDTGRDLETIVAKALALDPAQRYPSAAGFSDDLRRYLNGDAIVARPMSSLERAAYFARKNRALVGGLALVFVLLVAGVAATSWQASLARAARSESEERGRAAQAAAERAERINELLLSVIQAGNPIARAKPAEYTVREALQEAGSRLDAEPLDDPRSEADLRAALGAAWRSLGQLERAERALLRALELREQLGEPLPLAELSNELGVLRNDQGRHDEAREHFVRALELYGGEPGTEARRGTSEYNLGALLAARGESAAARVQLEKALELHLGALGEGSLSVGNDLSLLASVEFVEGREREAIDRLRRAVAAYRASAEPEHPQAARAMNTLATWLVPYNELEEAAVLLREALAIERKIFGAGHLELADTVRSLGIIEALSGAHAPARAHAAESVEILRAGGAAPAALADSLIGFGNVLQLAGDWETSEDPLREAFDLVSVGAVATAVERSTAAAALARTLLHLGQLQGAEALFEQALAGFTAGGQSGHIELARSRVGLARILARSGRGERAEELLRAALPGFAGDYRILRVFRAEALAELARILEADGRLAEARETVEAALALHAGLGDPPAADLVALRARLGSNSAAAAR